MQSYEDLELIVIDDGSDDGTAEILNGFVDDRLRVYTQKNQGLTRSLNTGIGLARGKYVARQDADDLSQAERLAIQVRQLEKDAELGFVGSWARMIDNEGRAFADLAYAVEDSALRDRHLSENQFVHGSLMFRRDNFVAVGGYRPGFRYAQDYDLTLRLQEKYKTMNIPRYLYFLRHRESKLSYLHGGEQVEFASLARTLAVERRTLGCETTDITQQSAGFTGGRNKTLCSYEDEIIYQALKSGYTDVAKDYLRGEIARGRGRLKNTIRLLLCLFGGRISRTVYAGAERMRR